MSRKLIAASAIAILISACASDSGIGSQATINVFCSHYPDADHSPIEFFTGDTEPEESQKMDLLKIWMVLCDVEI